MLKYTPLNCDIKEPLNRPQPRALLRSVFSNNVLWMFVRKLNGLEGVFRTDGFCAEIKFHPWIDLLKVVNH
jgi:hypothetical protein